MSKPSEIRRLVHDARNPLNRISMQAELAKMLVEQAAETPQIVHALELIISGCQECSDRLQDISDAQNKNEIY